MTKEEIHVVLPMKAFDTYKMDSWTPEQWKKFVGEETGPVSIQLLLLNDNEFYLKIMGVSFREVTEEMFFGFEAQNKFNRNITIQFGKWIIDDCIYNLSHEKPLFLEKSSGVRGFQKCVQRTYLEEWNRVIIEINILDAESNSIIRELEFQINKQYNQFF